MNGCNQFDSSMLTASLTVATRTTMLYTLHCILYTLFILLYTVLYHSQAEYDANDSHNYTTECMLDS
jgi:hypothetical protein